MQELDFAGVNPVAAERVRPLFESLLDRFAADIRSVYVTGSAVTADFDEKSSDVNSLVLLTEVRIEVLDFLAASGSKHGRRGVHAPLLMTPRYVERSLDVFPVEFLDLKLVNHRVMGEDLLARLEIDPGDVRRQCEREVKARLVALRQGYVCTLGDAAPIRELLEGSLAGLVPLLRGVLLALKQEVPCERSRVLASLHETTGVDRSSLEAVFHLRQDSRRRPAEELKSLFVRYYGTLEKLADVMDAPSR